MTTIEKITAVCDGIKSLLIAKNRKYGDAATHPLHIFSKDDAAGAIRARIDDKLSRIANAQSDDADYRGEITAVFDDQFLPGLGYKAGDRFCQLMIVAIPYVEWREAKDLSRTARGLGGYGSTGR